MQPTEPVQVRVGCAGWSIRREWAESFPPEGSHLERYAQRFPAVEINSCFYRPHRPATYARWAASVPKHFRFAVKVPKEITHNRRLVDSGQSLDRFLEEVGALESKLGPLLVQLPPSLAFEKTVAMQFFRTLSARFKGHVACEPRHESWFNEEVSGFLAGLQVGRVAADPALVPSAAEPGGWRGLVYFRLHGSPRMYYSSYPEEYLQSLAEKSLRCRNTAAVWCIFDNTALGAATANALDFVARLERCGDGTPASDE